MLPAEVAAEGTTVPRSVLVTRRSRIRARLSAAAALALLGEGLAISSAFGLEEDSLLEFLGLSSWF